jgi:MoxR-like ATPase
LLRAAQARAALAGRPFVLPDDVKTLAVPALAHRMLVRPQAGGPTDVEAIIAEIVAGTPVPVFEERRADA